MITTSPEWTEEDRLTVIAELAQTGQLNVNKRANYSTLFDTFERVRLVATARKTFLEANREQIMEGL